MRYWSRAARLASALAVVMVTTVLNGLLGPTSGDAAAAASAPGLSGIILNPEIGGLDDHLALDTTWLCPDGNNFVGVKLAGPGLTTTDLLPAVAYNGVNAPPNDLGGFHLDVPKTLGGLFAENGVTDPTGDYAFAVTCNRSPDDFVFWVGKRLRFTSDQSATYVQIEPIRPTITVTPAMESPVAYDPNHNLAFTATISPAEASGVVRMTANGSAMGSSGTIVPAPSVNAFWNLSPGTYTVKAEFEQAHHYEYLRAFSVPFTYVVAGPTSLRGVPRVRQKLTCSGTSGATRTFAWRLDGVVLAARTTQTVLAPPSWAGHRAGCSITTSDEDSSVTRRSPTRTIKLAVAPVPQTRPSIHGLARVGNELFCTHGRWVPTPARYTYLWKRTGEPLRHATARTHRVVNADRGRRLTCSVTATIPGHHPATASSTPHAVRR